MALTLNQIVNRIKTLALSHKQVSTFYYGNVADFLDSEEGQERYPILIAEDSGFDISTDSNQRRVTFRLFYLQPCDLAKDSLENETDTLSDGLSVMEDMYAMLANPQYQDDYTLEKTASGQFLREQREDYLSGCYLDIVITVDYNTDSCRVPADGVTFQTDDTMKLPQVWTYRATGSEGSTINTNSIVPIGYSAAVPLSNMLIMTFVREHSVIDPVSSSPAPDEYIYNANGAFTLGASLEAGEFLQIIYRKL